MSEQEVVKESIVEIFRKNGYAEQANMTQRDYEYIGMEIEKKSRVLISGTTIKRLANGEFSRLPQIATLNAIANYFDYQTWQAYKASKAEPEPKEAISNATDKPRRSFKYLSFLSILPIVAGIYFVISARKSVSNVEKASFSFRKNTANAIPNTVVFNYNVDDVRADSFFIQQSWDKNRRVKIYKNQYTLTDIYYEPGFHIAKLIANDSIIKSVEVSIPTDRWFFYAIDNVRNYIPEYIKADDYLAEGILSLSTAHLQKNKIDANKDKIYQYVYFPSQMHVSGDNFKLKTRVRMQAVRNHLCPYITLEVFCQRYYMILKSTSPGCAHQAGVQFGEHVIKGEHADLAPLAFDVGQWTDVEMTVKDKMATISINGKKVFTTQYHHPTKSIAGLAFISNGLCQVDYVSLRGLDGKVVYESEF